MINFINFFEMGVLTMNGMLKKGLLTLLVLAACVPAFAADPEVNIIPWPKSLTMGVGDMTLSGASQVVYADPNLSGLADVVIDEVAEITRLQLTKIQGTSPSAGDIYLKYTAEQTITGEAYKVVVDTYATAEAANYNAIAMATVSIIQAIKDNGGSYSIPKMTINDEPDNGYRGFMIDVARQQHSIKTLKEMVDMCRHYKVRFMQIHFNDDQAYTLPSLTYPDLAGKSSYSYTHAEVTDLVAYADKRGVIIIPEIEVPAHASAMIANMPDPFAGGGGVINFASTEVWDALGVIINECCDMFQSSPYIHLGADEANLGGLDQQQEYIDAINTYGVGDIHGLFNYFISHLDDDIKARGKKTVVWEGFGYWNTGNAKMDPDVHVMMFDNAKSPQAYIDAGHKVINASWNPMYVVGFEGRGFGCPAHWIFQWDKSMFHGYQNYPMTWERTTFNPLVPSDQVVGGQMCSWEMLEWREIPRVRFRIPAFADRIWNAGNTNDYAHYETRYNSTDVLLDYVLAEHRAPDAPINVGASDGFYEDKVRVGWGDLREGGGNFPRKYTLYRNTTNNSATATPIAEDLPKTTSSYEDTNVTMGQTYYYWVKAWNKWGWSNFSAVASGKAGVQPVAKAYESFDYAVGSNIHGLNGGTGFSDAWNKFRDSGPITTVADSLSYPGLPSEAGAMYVDHTINEAAELSRHLTESVGEDMTELWASFLVKGDPVKYGWMTADFNGGQRFGKQSVNGIGIFYDTSVFMESNVTYFFVLYIDYRPGNDYMYMWVNPSTDQKPSLDDYAGIWETSDQPQGNTFRFNLSGTEFGKYTIDELRIGTTWEDAIGVSNLDPDAPTPNPMTWVSEPTAQGKTSATMECATASHPDGVEYFFEEVTGNPGGDDSGWIPGPTYTDTGLQSGYTYTYRAKARNLSAGYNETYWTVPASMVPPNESIGVNMASDRGGTTIAGETFDGCSNWTDASGANGTGLAVLGSGGFVTCDWTANNTWAFGPTSTPGEELYYGYLDDPSAGCSITLTGLSGWLATVGRGSYTVRLYANTDTSGHTFSDVEIYSGGSVVDTVAYTTYDYTVGGSRSTADSISLSADTITIDPLPNGTLERATLAGIQIIAAPGVITPYLQINGGAMQNTDVATLGIGDTIVLSPQAPVSGTWSWSGPDGFTAGTREVTIDTIQETQAGAYVVTFTSDTAEVSDHTFNVTVVVPDNDPPTPDPSTFATPPYATGSYSIAMVAMTASDLRFDVEYYFECVSGGGNDSGWQSSPSYEDTGLLPEATYEYRVKTRDTSPNQNETAYSQAFSATTDSEPVVLDSGIGVNFTHVGDAEMGTDAFDGVADWTDTSGASGGPTAIDGGAGATVSWSASNTWQFGPVGTPEEKLYKGYLDDGGDGCTVTLTGLSAWLTAEGATSYVVRVYANTDSGGHTFSDVEIYADGSVVDTIVYVDYNTSLGGARAVADSGSLSADTITIDPVPGIWGQERATIAGVQIIPVAAEIVTLEDFALFAAEWGRTDCVAPDYCNAADFNQSGSVDVMDLAEIVAAWLQ